MSICELIKKTIIVLDKKFNMSLYAKAVIIKKAWYNSIFLNILRCKVNPTMVKLKQKFRRGNKKILKLHLGCGDQHLDGYGNIELRKTAATDVVFDIRKLPYSDNSIQEIITMHVIEHLPRHVIPHVLRKWRRVLIPGGRLIIECPNFDEAVKEYMAGNEERLDDIFGQQKYRGDIHFCGYNYTRLKIMLVEANYYNIQNKEPQDFHIEFHPCLRVECVKR